MLGGPRVTAQACRGALRKGSNTSLRLHGFSALEVLPPTFLCPAIDASSSSRAGPSTPGPSTSSRPFHSLRRSNLTLAATTSRHPAKHALASATSHRRSYSTQSATATVEDEQAQLWHQGKDVARQKDTSLRSSRSRQSTRSPNASHDWRRKFPITQWRREMDFNRYSQPLRRRNLPEDAPALYEDEIKASSAWLPKSQWTLTVPDDYPLRHELFLILDSLDDISQSAPDPDCGDMLIETLRQARELIWSNPEHTLRRQQDRDVALYLAGKVAETYVKLDAADSMDRLMAFLDFVRKQIGVLPLPCFHALAARAGITRRYDAVLKICEVAQEHHGGKADAELLHLRLRGLIAQSKDIDLTRYWDLFANADTPAPRKTFDLLLRTQVRRQDVAQVNQVLEAMPQHGHEIDARAWLTILRGFQTFRPTLAAMLRRDAKIVQSPTLNVVNRLLQMLANELDVDGALMVLRIFRIPSIDDLNVAGVTPAVKDESLIVIGPSPQPNAQTYTILTRLFGRLGRGHEALAFFRLALSTCDRQSVDAASERALQQASASVMKAYLNAGHPVRAMAFATKVLHVPYFGSAEGTSAPPLHFKLPASAEVSIAATNAHYRILLECASAHGSADAARRIVVHLLEQGHEIDQEVLRGLARLIFSTIDADALEAIRVIRRLLPQGIKSSKKANKSEREHRLESLSDLLQHLGTSEKVTLASQHPTDLNHESDAVGTKAQPTELSRETAKSTTRNESTKDELRDWLIRDSSSVFRGLTPTQNTEGDTSALAQDLSRPLSPEAYALRIRVYAVVRRDHDSAQKVYHAMLAHGAKPTMMHIAPLIEGLTAVGKLEEAQRLKRNAREVTGFQPTLRIHTAFIRAYVRAGDSNAARKEIQELTGNGYEIDETISNIIEAAQSGRRNFSLVDRPLDSRDTHSVATRFHGLMRMRRYLAAQELLQSALDSGLRSDKVLHDLVRRSVTYLQKQRANATGLGTATIPNTATAPNSSRSQMKAGKSPVTNDNMTRSSNSNYSSHVFELAQAIRLAQSNKERVTKSMANYSLSRRRQIKEHRNKVVSLILDFADGKLEAAAKSKGGQSGRRT